MAFWRPNKKKEKEKRKALPRQPTRITSTLTLIIVLGFIALWLLVVNPPAPPVPEKTIPMPPSVLTPTIEPIIDPSVTPTVVQEFNPLQLTGVCTEGNTTYWQVLNPNPYAVKFTATTRSLGTWATQPGTVPAMSNGRPGALQLRSYFEKPGVITSLTIDGSDLTALSPNNPQPCSFIQTEQPYPT